jgi:hypothetical protein
MMRRAPSPLSLNRSDDAGGRERSAYRPSLQINPLAARWFRRQAARTASGRRQCTPATENNDLKSKTWGMEDTSGIEPEYSVLQTDA